MIFLTYILQFFLTNVFFAAVIALLLNRFNRSGKYSLAELLIYSVGIASAVVTLLLYYLFLFIPRLSTQAYFLIVLFCFLIPAFFLRKDFVLFGETFKGIKFRINASNESKWIIFLFVSGCLVFFIGAQWIIFNRPLIEHDVLEYGVQAKIFFRERCIRYVKDRFDVETGYYFVGLHGFSFMLLSVWERLCNALTLVDKDLFFRGITTHYTLMIVLVQFYWFAKKDLILALIASALLFASSGFIMTAMIYHLDTYRIFLLMMSMIAMLKAVQFNDRLSIYLFGCLAGLSAFTHSLNALLSLAETGIYFLLVNDSMLNRIKSTTLILILLLLFGGVHYILDVFWGTGWIFKDIKFY